MHRANTPDHPRHDATLIAGHAAGDLPGPELATVERLLATCSECSLLHRDLIALAAASRDLPAPPRPERDFRLAAEQAGRLRRGSWVRNLLRPFASPGSSARPLATAFTSVGAAGLLLAAFVPGMLGGIAAGPSERELTVGAAQASAPPVEDASGAGGGPAAAPGSSGEDFGVDPLSTAEPRLDASGDTDTPRQSDSSAIAQGGDQGSGDSNGDGRVEASASGPNLVLIASLAFLTVGLGLFALRMAGRRLDA